MSCRNLFLAMVLSLACFAGVGWGKRGEPAAEQVPARPALPEIQSIQLEPASLTLHDGRDEQQVLVWGVTHDGQKFDLSDEAKFTRTRGRAMAPIVAKTGPRDPQSLTWPVWRSSPSEPGLVWVT